jgi:hypothetical protein
MVGLEPWYADMCDQRHTQVFCGAHTHFVDLIHHCRSLNTYRESNGVYCSKMGWVLTLGTLRAWGVL